MAAFACAAIGVGFMLAFHFPRPIIWFFGVASLFMAGASVLVRRSVLAVSRPGPQAASQQPASVIVLSVAIAILGFVFVTCLLFSLVAFLNAHEAVERVEGQPYRATTFEVVRPYYQKSPGMHGPEISMYASGRVEGQKEWMGLVPYLKRLPSLAHMPTNQAELDDAVPRGTTIPVYLFPGLKGRSRVEVIGDLPPGEADRRTEVWVLRHGPVALLVLGGLIFLLVRIRRSRISSASQAVLEVPG